MVKTFAAKKKKSTIAQSLAARPKIDRPLLIVTLVLVVFGLVMMFSASFASAYYMYGDGYRYIKKQLVFAAFGVFMMLFISQVNYHILHKFAWPFFLLSYALLVLTLFMKPINNARRWIIIGNSFTFQPSEFMKFAIILLFSHFISTNPKRMQEFKYGFLVPMGVLVAVAVVLLKQPHLSCTLIIVCVGCVVLFIGGTKLRYFLISGGIGIPALVSFLVATDKMSYVLSRVSTWVESIFDSSLCEYQTLQSLIAIGSGGLMGLGLGNSRQKHLYVPEPQNDFIFSIICEELGYVGALFVILLFVLFVIRGFKIALHAKDKFGMMLAIGVTTLIGLQALLNIAVVTNTVPNTGISLPFFSSGGTSLVVLLAQVGVLLSISRFSSVNPQ